MEEQAVYASIRLSLDQLEKDAAKAKNAVSSLSDNLNKEGQAAGKQYVTGFGKGIDQINTRLNNFVSAMKSIGGKAGAIGENFANLFSKPIFSMLPKLAAAVTTALPIIAMLGAAIAVVVKAVSGAAKAQKEFNDNINLARQAQDALTGSMKTASGELTGQERSAAALSIIIKKLGDVFEPVLKLFKDAKDAIGGAFAWIADKIGLASEAEVTAAANAQKLANENKALVDSTKDYNKTLKDIETAEKHGVIAAEEANAKRQSAAENYLNKLIELRNATAAVAGENSRETAEYDKAIEAQVNLANSYKKTIDEKDSFLELQKEYERELKTISVELKTNIITQEEADRKKLSNAERYLSSLAKLRTERVELNVAEDESVKIVDEEIAAQVKLRNTLKDTVTAWDELNKPQAESVLEKVTKAQEAAMENYRQSIKKADDALSAHLINEEEYAAQLHKAEEQKYTDLENIIAQYGAQADALIELRDETAVLVKQQKDSAAASELVSSIEKEKIAALQKQSDEMIQAEAARLKENGHIQDAIALENQLIDIQRQREKDLIMESEAYKNASEEQKQKIIKDFDEITKEMYKTAEEGKKAQFFDTKMWQDGMAMAQQAVSTFTSISAAIIGAQRKAIEEQIAQIDILLQAELDSIENMRQRALEEANFIEATTEESLIERIEQAKAAGDEILQYQYERRLEEKRINDKFDAEAKAATKKAEEEKASLEYKVALAQWEADKVTALTTGALAVMNALASGWKAGAVFAGIYAALAAAASAVQYAVIAGNPPKPPQFADGGIVPGTSYSGDKVAAYLNSGELILNKAQQDNVAGQLAGGGGTELIVIMQVDGEELARSAAKVYGSGRVLIPLRGIDGI